MNAIDLLALTADGIKSSPPYSYVKLAIFNLRTLDILFNAYNGVDMFEVIKKRNTSPGICQKGEAQKVKTAVYIIT